MMTCNRIQRLIDEADKPEALPFAAASHIADCPACSQFAEERTKLRAFLIELPRVNAPAHFDTMLKMRLAESKAAKPSSWFTPVFAMRFGAVAAVALVAVLSVPYLNNFSAAPITATNASVGLYRPDTTAIAELMKERASREAMVNVDGGNEFTLIPVSATSKPKRGVHSEPKSINDFAVNGTPIIIKVDDQDTFSMPMLPVSVGAQQQMMMRSSRPTAKPLAISF